MRMRMREALRLREKARKKGARTEYWFTKVRGLECKVDIELPI